MIINQYTVASHRNGICGAPFHAILFQDTASLKLGIVFENPSYCAVLDVAKLAVGNIRFGSNSFRGDHFEDALRRCIANYSDEPPEVSPQLCTGLTTPLLSALLDIKRLATRPRDFYNPFVLIDLLGSIANDAIIEAIGGAQ
jgi:hypothetical protein